MTLDLYRFRFKDGNKAADSALVWASSQESAEILGQGWCDLRGHRFICAALETVAREGQPLDTAPDLPPGVIKPIKPAALPSAAVYAEARAATK